MTNLGRVISTGHQKVGRLDANGASKLALKGARKLFPNLVRKLGTCLLLCGPLGFVQAGQFVAAVQSLSFSELSQTFDKKKVAATLGKNGMKLDAYEKQAAALLVTMGALDAAEVDNASIAMDRVDQFVSVVNSRHPALMGRIGDPSVLHHMAGAFRYGNLLKENAFLDRLGQALSDGVLTGYDLRMKGVYDNFPAGHTFVYSQSNLVHLQQLVTLMASEGINGWVYLTPKVSAFLYREDWGPASEAVKTLESGVRVVQGREVAAMFQFDAAGDRMRFHEMMLRYAKKDSEDEVGLITSSWWQPFYYSDQALKGFKPISLLVISSDRHEATLTVLEEKTESVVAALADLPWPSRVDRVWVNPAFYRFLNGDYK
ncbi:MAG: hypothetical protein ACI8Z1_003358 [Candidatus Azotimanducaceae bacterium]